MADLSDSVNWSETDASNNKASPLGWPEGMMPSGVNDSARADKGALKRFWDRINPVAQIAPVGNLWTYTTANPAYPTSYIDGEVYNFLAGAWGVGGDLFQVNALGAKPIWKQTTGGWLAVVAGDIGASTSAQLTHNASLNGGSGAFILLNPHVPALNDGAGGVAVPGPIYSTGANGGFYFYDHTTPSIAWVWYADAGSARLYSSGDKITVDNTGTLHAVNSITAAGNLAGAALFVTGGIYFNGILFANSDGTTSHIFDGAGGNAIHLQAAANFYDADTHTFRNNAGAVNLLTVDGSGLTLNGNYIHFAGSTGTVNTTGGPLIFADNANHVYKQGPGNGSWLFQNYAGTVVAGLSSAGTLSLTGSLGATTIGAVQYNISGFPFATSDGTTTLIYDPAGGVGIHLQAAGTYYDADLHHFRNNAGVEKATIDASGNLFLGGPYILFNGNASVAQGPFLQVNNTDWIQRLGTGAGRWWFETSAGGIVASIDSAGNIYSPLLQGGVAGGGTLKGITTADPTGHAISFGWDGVNSVFYRNIDGSRTDTLIWSDAIRAMLLVTDGGSPSGWKLQAFSGGAVFNIYVTNTTSDARLKRGIDDSKVDALAAICAVPVRRFEWRKEVQATFGVPQKPVEIGLVAQDLMPHMPDCVGISEGGEKPYPADTHTLMHERIEAYLFRAVQQLGARLAQLEAK